MDQDKLKSVAWDELYKVFSEQLDEDKVSLMNSILQSVENDVKDLEKQMNHNKCRND